MYLICGRREFDSYRNSHCVWHCGDSVSYVVNYSPVAMDENKLWRSWKAVCAQILQMFSCASSPTFGCVCPSTLWARVHVFHQFVGIVCVYMLDRNAFAWGVIKDCCNSFECSPDVIVRDIMSACVDEHSKERSCPDILIFSQIWRKAWPNAHVTSKMTLPFHLWSKRRSCQPLFWLLSFQVDDVVGHHSFREM